MVLGCQRSSRGYRFRHRKIARFRRASGEHNRQSFHWQAREFSDGVVLVEGNCQDESCITGLGSESPEAIIHIVGESPGEIGLEEPAYDLQAIIQSTLLHAYRDPGQT